MENLQPLGNWVCHAKLIEVHPSNISWNLLPGKIFNSQISVAMYHGQRVTTLVLCGANRLKPQNTAPLTFWKSLYPSAILAQKSAWWNSIGGGVGFVDLARWGHSCLTIMHARDMIFVRGCYGTVDYLVSMWSTNSGSFNSGGSWQLFCWNVGRIQISSD